MSGTSIQSEAIVPSAIVWKRNYNEDYYVGRMLIETLDQRTGNTGWYSLESDSDWEFGDIIVVSRDQAAHNILWLLAETAECSAIRAACSLDERVLPSRIEGLDDPMQRQLVALYWSRRADKYAQWGNSQGSTLEQKARKKVNRALYSVKKQTCEHCGSTYRPDLQVPSPADIRRLVEKVVDKYFCTLLLKAYEENRGN